MLYDVRLALKYEYEAPVQGGRHLIRVAPVSIAGVQRVIAAGLSFDPTPQRKSTFTDFFGNSVTTISYHAPHDHLTIRLTARVQVEDTQPPADLSPNRMALRQEIARTWSVAPDSPHHFLAASPRAPLIAEISAYAETAATGTVSVQAAAMALCLAIHRDFTYDPRATDVETKPDEAFALRKGVCQDFAHVMIAGLRGLGIPAGYVSGFLRTIPPAGKPRLEGADAMHAWVRVWCGQHTGWIEFDPTNAMIAGPDHIAIGHGRDYADISPIIGVLRTHGSHETTQSVDVIRVE
ncbi:transglutaminase [Devosia limi DSM 17137]|uniref:Transglutaminase n=1 Tax=Devosia limi DSM 17137 TaxID=1121477 RepID=A0A0F5LPK7_9HYPH|nr:transglutaminase family protein [Devosia limi]KKB84230.1 transglutaminase [Devosia limi DSM 17137]KKB84285.1 transglutaminase [Devosia limi DSM 17137]SHE82821.1 Transglutaminase-like enzyme, putative cysteine protease [Devosia limi DSM 17137]